MVSAKVLNTDGSVLKSVELPSAFSERVRPDLIARAVTAESSLALQPQAHFVLAGMQTTARYYGAMNSYRTGRHMGMAIRPREKLGGGAQGKVRRIPSAVTGKRAHPHMVEKRITESMNRQEYQKAIKSAIAATAQHAIIVSDHIESIKKTKEVSKTLSKLQLGESLEKGRVKEKRKGIRRLSSQRRYKKSILIVVGDDKGIVKAARNMAGVDVCSIQNVRANLLAPGGRPGRATVWSESALTKMEHDIGSLSLS